MTDPLGLEILAQPWRQISVYNGMWFMLVKIVHAPEDSQRQAHQQKPVKAYSYSNKEIAKVSTNVLAYRIELPRTFIIHCQYFA